MAIQLGLALRNARLDAIMAVAGNDAILCFYTGSAPADCAAAPQGAVLCDIPLAGSWLTVASGGQVSKNGTWQGTGSAAGQAGHFRIYNSAHAICHMQGMATGVGGGGECILDNPSIALNQTVTVNSFNISESGG